MTSKTSKAQLEVWKWKEALSEELKRIPRNERLRYIREKTKPVVEKLKKKMPL